jgi:hypothetical protein
MKPTTLVTLGILAASLLTAGASAQAKVHPTALTEVGSGYRVRLIDKAANTYLAGKEVRFRIVYSDPRQPQTTGVRRTDSTGQVWVGGAGVVKVIFNYDGQSGVYGASSKVDSKP